MRPSKPLFVRFGDFLFTFRNLLFPTVLAVVFLTYAPPYAYFGYEDIEEGKDAMAVALMLLGLATRGAVIGFAYIKRGGLNKKVYAENLVTQGFFGVCRNPLYVGNMLIYVGVFLMHGNPVVFVGGSLGIFIVYSAIIAAEEYFLRGTFGEAYQAYCRDVPRWLPKLSRLKKATEGMHFNARRVLVKDYTTIANTAFVVVLLELLETAHHTPFTRHHWPVGSIAALLGLIAVTAGISFAKKKKWITAT